jgi:hypothetical protein
MHILDEIQTWLLTLAGGTVGITLSFLPLLIGYIISYLSYLPSIHHFRGIRCKRPGTLEAEARLWWLLFCTSSHHLAWHLLTRVSGTTRSDRPLRLCVDLLRT